MECYICEHRQSNKKMIPVRTKKGMMQPLREYCQHPSIKHKEISSRAKGKYGQPIWCPIGAFKTCMICGTKIRAEEGDYCKNC